MALTPETLPRHELVGLPVRVAAASDRSRVDTEGRVVSETMRTLSVETASGVRQVPKAGTTFEFTLTDETAGTREGAGGASEPTGSAGPGGDDVTDVTVDGDVLLSRPARRTEHGDSQLWH